MEKDNRIVIDKYERLEFCSFEQSVELKKLGLILDSPFGYYGNDGELVIFGDEIFYGCTSAPLIQQAFRFFREKYGLIGLVEVGYDLTNIYCFVIWHCGKEMLFYDNYFDTYEEAEQACLNKLIEIAIGTYKQD